MRLEVDGDSRPCRVVAARGFVGRAAGLLALPPLKPGEALLISPCGSVHSFGMRYAIDVVFCDREGRVLRVARALQPRRLCVGGWRARWVLELLAGEAARLGIRSGARVRFT